MLKIIKDYDPVAMAMWEKGVAAPYLHVGRALAAMDSTTKRLRISDVIANMFRSLLALSPGISLLSPLHLLQSFPPSFLLDMSHRVIIILHVAPAPSGYQI